MPARGESLLTPRADSRPLFNGRSNWNKLEVEERASGGMGITPGGRSGHRSDARGQHSREGQCGDPADESRATVSL